MPDYQAEKGIEAFIALFCWLYFSFGNFQKRVLIQLCCFCVARVADNAKRFLAEFYVDGDGGKIFKYGEQLVSSHR